jgi:hypothetical protein
VHEVVALEVAAHEAVVTAAARRSRRGARGGGARGGGVRGSDLSTLFVGIAWYRAARARSSGIACRLGRFERHLFIFPPSTGRLFEHQYSRA